MSGIDRSKAAQTVVNLVIIALLACLIVAVWPVRELANRQLAELDQADALERIEQAVTQKNSYEFTRKRVQEKGSDDAYLKQLDEEVKRLDLEVATAVNAAEALGCSYEDITKVASRSNK